MKSYKIWTVTLLASMLLAFIYGAFSTSLEIFPYSYLEKTLTVTQSLRGAFQIDRYNNEIRWPKAIGETGLVSYDPERASDGLILYTSTHDTTARLIDRQGEVLHEWSVSFNELWPEQEHVIAYKKLDDQYFYLRDFHLYDNGDMLLMLSAGGVTPWGMGLVMLNKDSEVLWKYAGYPNNDFEVTPDGLIYSIVHKIRYEPIAGVVQDEIPFLEDRIVTFDREGVLIENVSLIDAIHSSPYADLLSQLQWASTEDPTHSNSISYVTVDQPSGVSWLKKGNLLISVRNLNAMLVYDPSEKRVVYAAQLAAQMQHDLDYLPNGNVMFFDNQGSFSEGGYSRVIEINPVTKEIIWSYDPSPSAIAFETEFWGAQQLLENDNVLVVHADAGRLIEVERDGTIVWEYISPLVRSAEDGDYVAVITAAENIDRDRAQFLQDSD